MNQIARFIELIVFGSRWLVVPFLFGLVVGLFALIIKFGLKLVDFALRVAAAEPTEAVTARSQTPAPESQGRPSPSATSPR